MAFNPAGSRKADAGYAPTRSKETHDVLDNGELIIMFQNEFAPEVIAWMPLPALYSN